jgi:hypothetical protein
MSPFFPVFRQVASFFSVTFYTSLSLSFPIVGLTLVSRQALLGMWYLDLRSVVV